MIADDQKLEQAQPRMHVEFRRDRMEIGDPRRQHACVCGSCGRSVDVLCHVGDDQDAMGAYYMKLCLECARHAVVLLTAAQQSNEVSGGKDGGKAPT